MLPEISAWCLGSHLAYLLCFLHLLFRLLALPTTLLYLELARSCAFLGH